jgi:hypothetical protein
VAEPQPLGRIAAAPFTIELWGEDDWRVFVNGERYTPLERSLTIRYRDAYEGPQQGHYGEAILLDLNKHLGGALVLADRPMAGFNEIP